MPTLNWIGKEKIINHHLDVPYRVLNHEYGFTEKGKQKVETDSGNKIIHGDNLEALKSLLPEYEGKITCIYIDPPYNTGNEGWVYNDNVSHPKLQKWLGEIVGKESDDLTRHDKWLCMMYPRLQLLHRLLADDGAIFISLDEHETYTLKTIMNEIFGENNFVAQITVLCNPKGRSQDKYFSTNHEYITVFSKKKKEKDSFSITKEESLIEKEYKLKDEAGRYRLLELRNTHREFNRQNRPNLFYPLYVNSKSGYVSLEKNENFSIEVTPLWPDNFEGCWTWGRELAFASSHLLIAKKTLNRWKIYRKSYSSSESGENVKRKLFTIWSDSRFYTEKGQSAFGKIFPGYNKNDFPQPKAVDLITEILKTCKGQNAIILDSFAGSGTTAHAVLNLNKQDGGNRKFILIELENYAETITAERVKRVIKGYSDVDGTGGSFDFYTVGEPLFDDDHNLNEAIPTEKIREYIWYSETRSKSMLVKTNSPFLGTHDDTGYYFIYDKKRLTALDYDSLAEYVTQKSERYVIYADNCLLPERFMREKNIEFKKIPRNITRF